MNVNNRDVDYTATGSECEHTRAWQKLGNLGGSNGGTESDVFKKEKVGMVQAWEKIDGTENITAVSR